MEVTLAIIGAVATLLAAIIATWRDIATSVSDLHAKLDAGLHDLRDESANLGERVARIEGRLEAQNLLDPSSDPDRAGEP